jgi:uncharacterized protein (DUF2141 family)
MLFTGGCAQIGAPTGGPKDTLVPVLVKASPENKTIQFKGNKVVLSFDEYIDLQDLPSNLLISPVQKYSPVISYNLKTITIKFKDTLAPNTTYSLNFGNAIKDINEGNVLKNFNYVFSTGDYIDSFELKGKVLMAETGKVDSTILVLLYRNSSDTAVQHRKADYTARLKGDGSFQFNYLPADQFSIYALKDGDGNKYYNAKSEIFGFSNDVVNINSNNPSITLYTYVEKKEPAKTGQGLVGDKKGGDKNLRFQNNINAGRQDLLSTLELTTKNALKKIDFDSIVLCDTSFKKIIGYTVSLDSTRKKIIIENKWQPENLLKLIVYKNGFQDSTGLAMSKNDTINFITRSTTEYGSLKLSFKNIDLSKHPVLQFMEGENIKLKSAITSTAWLNKMMLPGEFEVRILFDENNNGKWDAGDYSKKLQPEITLALPQKISIKADWENERDIDLK